MTLRLSYLHNGISYTGKTTSLYWIGALVTRIMGQQSPSVDKWLPVQDGSRLHTGSQRSAVNNSKYKHIRQYIYKSQHSVAWCQHHYCNLWLLMYVVTTLDGTHQLNPSVATFIWQKCSNKLTFSIISQCLDCTSIRNTCPWKIMTWISYIICAMVLYMVSLLIRI